MSEFTHSNNAGAKTDKTKFSWFILFVLSIVFIIIGLVIWVYFVNFNYELLNIENWWVDIIIRIKNFSDNPERWGQFGDYFGGILNPVIAGFALYLIAKSYDLQKKELKAARKLLKISTKAQNKQVKLAALTALLNSNLGKLDQLTNKVEYLYESLGCKYLGIGIDEKNYSIIPSLNENNSGKLSDYARVRTEINRIEKEIQELNEISSKLEEEIIELKDWKS